MLKLTIEQLQALDSLRLYLDGGDGNMWPSRNDWPTVIADPHSAERHFVRVSDLLAALEVALPAAPSRCNVPPEGWECSRAAGHEGPCAAT